MTIWNRVFGCRTKEYVPTEDDKRSVKLIPDGENSWRVVYAD